MSQKETMTKTSDVEEGTEALEGSPNSSSNANYYLDEGKVAGLSLQSGTRLRLQHLSAATGLIATYLIEIGVQIFVILHCWHSLVAWLDWPSFLILSSGLSSLLVTIVSMVWVCHGLDFVGRACARLLCYVMHFSLLGLLWRYLKLAFAYDHADAEEFVALRIFQVYIQSLPLTSIHLAWLITFPQEIFGRAFWLIIAEILSIGVALVISAYFKSAPPTHPHLSSLSTNFNQIKIPGGKRTSKVFSDNLRPPMPVTEKFYQESESSSVSVPVSWSQVLRIELNILSRMMLLLCRLLVLGILLAHLTLSTVIALPIHFLIVFAWISRTERPEVGTKVNDEEFGEVQPRDKCSTKEFLIYVCKCTYIIFWDFTSTLQGPMRLSTWALPAFLVIFENGALMILYSYEAQSAELAIILICTGCLIFGIPMFFFLNFVNVSNLNLMVAQCCEILTLKQHGSDSASFCTKSGDDRGDTPSTTTTPRMEKSDCCWGDLKNQNYQDSAKGLKIPRDDSGKIVGLSLTNTNGPESWDLGLTTKLGLEKGKPLIMANNYTNISEVLMMSARVKTAGSEKRLSKNSKMMKIEDEEGPPGALPTATWVPDTCCNDSNGSSNSRNTNTLLEPRVAEVEAEIQANPDDDMVLDNPHFVFYFPEQRAHRHHSVVRKLNVQSEMLQGKSSPRTTHHNHHHRKPPRSHASSFSRTSRCSPVPSFTGSKNSSARPMRTSTPVEIKKAARVIVNYPKHHHRHQHPTRIPIPSTRCHCHPLPRPTSECPVDPNNDPFYEKLMEDTYGILICEGDNHHPHSRDGQSKSHAQILENSTKLLHQRLKVLCAKCLQNHDPLLTNCLPSEEERPVIPSRLEPRVHLPMPHPLRNPPPSETTEYPSCTEMTWTAVGDDQLSVVSSHVSTATYTTWPRKAQMSMWATTATTSTTTNPKEFTSREYVRTWLLTSEARAKHYYNEWGRGSASGGVKRVHRSRTISTGSGGALSRSHHHGHRHAHTHVHGSTSTRLGKRHGPVGRGQSPKTLETLSILPSLFLAPPPKQKQHPVLPPHNLRSAPEVEIRPKQQIPIRTKEFYKDLEIIV